MRKKLLEYSWRKWIAFSFCLGVIIGFWACESDHLVDKAGLLRLSLNADTTSLKSGVNNMTKTYSDEFADFLTTSDYKIQITQDTGIICSYERFDKMPSEIELKKGSYMLVASKGDNLPAAFENPYFEGKKNFVIKEDMTTPLDVTCTLGNARITTVFTDDFKEAYSDYTVLLSTDYTDEEVEIVKDEYRPLYMQAAEEGTAMAIGIRLKKVTEETEKTYYVPTTLDIFRRQNIRLIFRTDGEAFEGIGLDVELDDTLEPMTFTTKIPQFMWNQFDKPTLCLYPTDFAQEIFSVSSGSYKPETEPYVYAVMPGGISSLALKYWKEGEPEEEAVVCDFATDEGVETAKGKQYYWTVGNSKKEKVNMKEATSAEMYLEGIINGLPSSENICLYNVQICGKDNTGKATETNTILFKVNVLPAGKPMILQANGASHSSEEKFDIVEGDVLSDDWVLAFTASGLIDKEATKIEVSDGQYFKEYYFMKDEEDVASLENAFKATVNKKSEAEAIVTFPKEFSEELTAPETGSKDYTFTFYLKDQLGTSSTYTKTITVKAPVFELKTTDLDAFAKRVILRVDLEGPEDENKLSFQYKPASGGDWLDVQSTGIKRVENSCVDTLKSLNPNESYLIRAWYNDKRESDIRQVKTEDDIPLEDGDFEDWYSKEVYKKQTWSVGTTGLGIYQWWPYKEGGSSWWTTRNALTTSQRDGVSCYYTSYSGTIPTSDGEGYSGKAAEISTLGFGEGSTYIDIMSGVIINNKAAGMLFIGSHSASTTKSSTYDGTETFNYGHEFTSRPTGFKFYYKFKSIAEESFKAYMVVEYRGEDGTIVELGRGELVSNDDKELFGDETVVKIDYNENISKYKATHMYIVFISSIADSPSVGLATGSLGAFDGYSDSRYVGNVLTVDNVKLIYE